MNKQEFEQYIYDEFPMPFQHTFTREMLTNILDYAEGMEETEQYNFLCGMIPEVTEKELREVCY